MATLRDPQRGCPWDLEQDFGSIAPYTIEEAYEVADAIERDDLRDLRDELGDLLLQVVFHAQMAKEIEAFDFGDVVESISDKMVRRHPHVFGTARIETGAAQRDTWEGLKAAERQARGGDASAIAGVAHTLPALVRAEKLGKRAARVGLDWPDVSGVLDKVREELDEVGAALALQKAEAVEEELGDLLLACASLARHCRVDPEQALRQACRKFENRFRNVETAVRDQRREWQDLSPQELDGLWNAAKLSES
jgi:nucleoside triphosphate diphosphatase